MMMRKIVVCLKAVPEYVDKVSLVKGQNKLQYESSGLFINESDEYALEQAVVLKKQYGSEISLITVGTLTSQNILYHGIAKGADRAIRIDAEIIDPHITSKVLAEVLKKMEYDLILTGVESRDYMASQVGVSLAVKLGIPFVYAVTNILTVDYQRMIRIIKELGGGIGQVMEISLPALLCIQSGAVPRTYTSTQKILKARSRQIETVQFDGLEVEEEMKIVDIFLPKEKHKVEFIEGQVNEVAAKILGKIRQGL